MPRPVTDPFAILGLDRRFAIDLKETEKKHRELSKALHPDRYVVPGERRAALEKSVLVNDAYRALKDPVRRAEVLFALANVAVGDGKEPMASSEFLMEMMEQREALADARAERDLEKVRMLGRAMADRKRALEELLDRVSWSDQEAVLRAVPSLGELRFYVRFVDEAKASEGALEDAG